MNLQGLDAIIFDFDGVLVESVDIKTQAFGEMYAEHGADVVAQVENYHLRHAGISRFDKFRYFQTGLLGGLPLTDQDVTDLAEKFSKLVTDKVVSAPMVGGAQDFLDSCLRRLPMFIVSGTPTTEMGVILERRELNRYFTDYWGSPTGKNENIAKLLRKHKLSASRCVMIGDALADLEGAASNSVSFLGRVPENHDNCFSADVTTFSDFHDLPASWR